MSPHLELRALLLLLAGLGLVGGGHARPAAAPRTQDVLLAFLDLEGRVVERPAAVVRLGGRVREPDGWRRSARLFRAVAERKLQVEWTDRSPLPGEGPLEVLLPEPRPGRSVWVTLRTDEAGRPKSSAVKTGPATVRATSPRPRRGTATVAAPPPNDDCADALPILLGATPFTTLEATLDGPAHPACLPNGQVWDDVWFELVAPASGLLTVSTCDAADFDTVLAVYAGTDCADLRFVDCNDDGPGCAGFTSELELVVLEGDSYLIRVGGFEAGLQGSGTLSLALDTSVGPPPNDECDAALPLPANSSATVDNTFASTSPDDPETCRLGGGAGEGTVWFDFVPSRPTALLETGRSAVADTVLALFDGADCGDLRLLACSDDADPAAGDFHGRLGVGDLVPGRVYKVLVASFDARNLGEITLDATCPAPLGRCCARDGRCSIVTEDACRAAGGAWDATPRCGGPPCPRPPANDSCDTAEPVGPLPATLLVDTTLADTDPVPGRDCGSPAGPYGNVWYELEGTGNTLTVSTCNAGTTLDTQLAVLCRDCGNPVCVGGDDDDLSCPFGPLSSTVRFATRAGARYLVSVGTATADAARGVIEVDFTDDGIPATGAVDCEPVGACCLDSGTCVEVGAAECAARGGVYFRDGSSCKDDVVIDGGFELGPGSGAWIELSTLFGTPICDELCGTGGSADPHFGGRYWAWFGGSPPGVGEDALLEQTLVLPVAPSTWLEFQLEIPFASGNEVDALTVTVDGIPVFQVTEADRSDYRAYAPVRVDLSDFADARPHVLRFEGSLTGLDRAGRPVQGSSFFVDDVRVLVARNRCR